MDINNKRRGFLTKLSLGIVAASEAVTQTQTFTLKNPGRDKQDPKNIGQKGKCFGMVIDLRKSTFLKLMKSFLPMDTHKNSLKHF